MLNRFRHGVSAYRSRKLCKRLVDWVMTTLKDERGVRAEDAVTVAATIVGERCIDLAGEFAMRDHDLGPGARTFSPRINEILCGDSAQSGWNEIPDVSVFGILRNGLDGGKYRDDDYPSLKDIFELYAAHVGEEKYWGKVPLSVPEDHQPFVLPLQIGFESRDFVDNILHEAKGDKRVCLTIATRSLADILNMVAGTLDPKTALTLALETVNGMAKTAPMTKAAMAQAQKDQTETE